MADLFEEFDKNLYRIGTVTDSGGTPLNNAPVSSTMAGSGSDPLQPNPLDPDNMQSGTLVTEIDAGDSGLGSTPPAGSTGDLQINSAGVFGTIDGLTLDTTGDARGSFALDLQAERTLVTQIASGTYGIALGSRNIVIGNDSIGIGYSNSTQSADCVAIGVSNSISGLNITAVGYNNTNSGGNTTATRGSLFGYQNVIGLDITQATALGYKNNVSGSQSTAVGWTNTVSAGSASAFGHENTVSSSAKLAVGRFNSATNTDAIAIGHGNTASGDTSLAIGTNCTASATNSTAIGNAVSNSTTNSVQIGANNTNKLHFNTSGNLGIDGTDFQDGVKVIFIANATTVPTTNPTGGGILYVTGGALTYRGSGGTVTTIAPA